MEARHVGQVVQKLNLTGGPVVGSLSHTDKVPTTVPLPSAKGMPANARSVPCPHRRLVGQQRMPRGITDDQRFPMTTTNFESDMSRVPDRGYPIRAHCIRRRSPVVEHQRHRRSIGADRPRRSSQRYCRSRGCRAPSKSPVSAPPQVDPGWTASRQTDRSGMWSLAMSQSARTRPQGAESDGYCDQSPGSSISALFVRPGIRPTRCGQCRLRYPAKRWSHYR